MGRIWPEWVGSRRYGATKLSVERGHWCCWTRAGRHRARPLADRRWRPILCRGVLRLLKFPQVVRPPHGWREIAWEILIVTIGVFIALIAQQWAENQSWKSKARTATEQLKEEVSDHYAWSVEWRMAEPCIVAQLDLLQQRVLGSGDRLVPAPVYTEPGLPSYVLREPSKEYHSAVWQAIISDGVSPHLEPPLRHELASHYSKAQLLTELSDRNLVDLDRLQVLTLPLPLDPSTRFSLIQTLAELRGRTKFMGLLSGQLIDHIVKEGMVPPPDATREKVSKYGTYKFCRAHGFPTRTFSEAMAALPN